MREMHVFFDGTGSQRLLEEIVTSLYSNQSMAGVKLRSYDLPSWPSEVKLAAMARVAVENGVRISEVSDWIVEHLATRQGSAHGQRFCIVTVT
jgi:hypothetical protein